MVVATLLAKLLGKRATRFSYRFLFIPGTIGAITWLAQNGEIVDRIRGGMTLMCLGDGRPLTYKRSFHGDSAIDRAATRVLRKSSSNRVVDFHPYGYDERQFNSPGYRLPVGALMRGRHGEFDEYHTSADNLQFVSEAQMNGAVEVLMEIVDVLEHNETYRNLFPFGEPQLGTRGIYREMAAENREMQLAMLWVLCLGDGEHTLLDVSDRSGIPFSQVRQAAELLTKHGLVRRESAPGRRETAAAPSSDLRHETRANCL
jgi:aminopeptidase-like protein